MSKNIIKKNIEEFSEIQGEWVLHRTMNTCSICDSPKGHTELKDFFIKSQTSLITHIESKTKEMEYSKDKADANFKIIPSMSRRIGYNQALSDLQTFLKTLLDNK